MQRTLLPWLALAGLVLACGDKDGGAGETSDGSETDADADADADTDTDADADADSDADADADSDADADADTDPPPTFAISGRVQSFLSGTPAAGICVDALDPTPLADGGLPVVMGTATSGEDGTFRIADVYGPDTAMLVQARPCAEGDPVFPSMFGLSAEAYGSIEAGGELPNLIVRSLDVDFKNSIEAGLARVGTTVDLGATGMVIGGVIDRSTNTPLGGAMVTCGDGCTAFYADATPDDGSFGVEGAANTATDAAAGALFVAPAGLGKSFTATADGYTFGGFDTSVLTRGSTSFAGVALMATLVGDPS